MSPVPVPPKNKLFINPPEQKPKLRNDSQKMVDDIDALIDAISKVPIDIVDVKVLIQEDQPFLKKTEFTPPEHLTYSAFKEHSGLRQLQRELNSTTKKPVRRPSKKTGEK